ncbi:MAG: hypothetical protein FGM37_03785 [Phycisphaerales bacterium]|nr:hypothetical protein [Phycisphaerales bacterium]
MTAQPSGLDESDIAAERQWDEARTRRRFMLAVLAVALLVPCAGIPVLVSWLIPDAERTLREAKAAQAQLEMQSLLGLVEAREAITGLQVDSISQVRGAGSQTPGTDPWNGTYRLGRTELGYPYVESPGPDGRFGTDDDLRNPPKPTTQ